ncbi:MAG: glycosyltransferase family 39 protein [Candidatus Binatia bacterium]
MFRHGMNSAIEHEEEPLQRRLVASLSDYGTFVVIWAFCLFILFQNLGAAGLFEPDEGRNAEKAREILLLGDWVTPHENFLPVLDKPIFFYWLIALAYQIFGFSEWAARLPSALAALGCLFVIYRFIRKHWGPTEALWSTLILVTSAEFFILSRVVLFDMVLNFFITLSLCAFYTATRTENIQARRYPCLLMYGAMAAGTLIKGPVALLIPGMIIFSYLFIRREWSVCRQLHFRWGAPLFLLLVVPCYLWIEARNPGYLHYFLWDENFGRFLSPEFDRAQPWYYFLGVLFVGSLPWTFLLPLVVKDHWTRPLEGRNLFLILWLVLPFVFFSASKAKLPHYILPIFPPLAVLIAQSLIHRLADPAERKRWLLYTPWIVQIAGILYLIVGSGWPAVLPSQIRQSVGQIPSTLWAIGLLLVFIHAAFCYGRASGYWRGHRSLWFAHCLAALCFLVFVGRMMAATSAERSAKLVVANAAQWIQDRVQIVFYDTYLTGTLFYLRADRPVWIVTHANKENTVLGNYYVVEKLDRPETPWGKALYTFDEFRAIWTESERPMIVIIKDKNIPRMKRQIGALGTELGRVDEYVLLANEPTIAKRIAALGSSLQSP